MFPERIETDRLHLERLCYDNVDLFDLYESASRHEPDIDEVTEYLSWNMHENPKDTKNYVDAMEEKWEDDEVAAYVLRTKEGAPPVGARVGPGDIAGTSGLTIDWDRRTATLGLWLRKPFWGYGYSGERAAAMMELAFDRLDLELVAITHQTGNEKSKRAIEKYVEAHGGQYDGLLRNWAVDTDGEPIDQRRYTVTREQYREATP